MKRISHDHKTTNNRSLHEVDKKSPFELKLGDDVNDANEDLVISCFVNST